MLRLNEAGTVKIVNTDNRGKQNTVEVFEQAD